MSQQRISGTCERQLTEPTILQTAKRRTARAFISAVVFSLCTVGISACQNLQPGQPNPVQPELATPANILTPTPSSSFIETTPTSPSAFPNRFVYNDFSIGYPDSWTLLDMSVDSQFPLRERLSSLYGSDKVIALEKDGLYLILTIERESEGGSGGIFLDDQQYDEFVSDKDELVIGGSTFYLRMSHDSISALLDAHSGPFGWSVLAEYIPEVATQSGKVYRGFENVIRRNGLLYNFILVSDDGGKTPSPLQQEMMEMLESIEW